MTIDRGGQRGSSIRRLGRGRSDDTPLLALGAVALAVGTVVAVVVLTTIFVSAFSR